MPPTYSAEFRFISHLLKLLGSDLHGHGRRRGPSLFEVQLQEEGLVDPEVVALLLVHRETRLAWVVVDLGLSPADPACVQARTARLPAPDLETSEAVLTLARRYARKMKATQRTAASLHATAADPRVARWLRKDM